MSLGAGVKPVASPEHPDDASYTFPVWVRGSPTPGTSAIVADASGPGVDSTQPAETGVPTTNRVVRCSAKRSSVAAMGGPILLLIARGGTSVVLQPWFFDNTLNAWVKFGGTSTITLATTDVAAIAIRGMIGAKFYVQIVSPVNGTVTEVGYDIV